MSATQAGVVIAHLGQALAVESSDGRLITCQSRRQLGGVAVGDRVRWLPVGAEQGRVESLEPRSSLLERPAYGGKTRPVAANLNQVWVVVAAEPEADHLLVDQILAVCLHRAIDAGLIVNKTDLPGSTALLQHLQADYAAAGYPLLTLSTRQGAGLDDLRQRLTGLSSLLTGQSGVGKSSITQALLPERDIRIGQISAASGLGRHTTTTATLYHLPNGGDLIDSPGVAVFGLAGMNARDLAWGYREFQPLLERCRYNDCLHRQDAGCAVRAAAQDGLISSARYQRYLKLLDKLAGF